MIGGTIARRVLRGGAEGFRGFPGQVGMRKEVGRSRLGKTRGGKGTRVGAEGSRGESNWGGRDRRYIRGGAKKKFVGKMA